MTDTVKNEGNARAAASTSRYYLSLDTTKGTGDIRLDRVRATPSLEAGLSFPGPAITVTIPSTTPLNTYYLLACADDTGVVTELHDDNNCRASATTVQVARPDLVVTLVSNPPSAVAPGGQFAVTDSVKNEGAVSSASSTTRYYLSADGQKGSGNTLLVGSRGVPSLAAGASHAGPAITVTLPSTTAVNTYYLLACADDTRHRDGDGQQQQLSGRHDDGAGDATGPGDDRGIESSGDGGAGRALCNYGYRQEPGAVLSASSTTRYYLSPDGQKGSGDTLLIGTRGVPVLPPAPRAPAPAISLTIPSTTPPGLHYLLACADDAAVVIETDESNNCKASSSQVAVGP